MAALEDRPDADGEIEPARVAAIEAAITGRHAVAIAALRAGGPVWPKPGFKVLPGCFLVREQLE